VITDGPAEMRVDVEHCPAAADVAVRLPEEIAQRVQRYAEDQGVAASSVIRSALRARYTASWGSSATA